MDPQPPADSEASPQLIRRQIRRGATSCWECKRRKQACKRPNATSDECIFCSQRGIRCLRQEFVPEVKLTADPPPLKSKKKPHKPPKRPSRAAPPPPQDLPPRVQIFDSVLVQEATEAEDPQQKERDDLSVQLHSALPSQNDCDVIIGSANTACFLQFFTLPYGDLFRGRVRSAKALSTHPPLLSHPVLVARLLLYLAHGIQNIHPCALDVDELELVSPSLSMTTFFKAATIVTKKDHLLNSLEGLECLVLEGTFLINAGELKNARDTFRRAWHLARDMRLPCQGADIVTLDSQSIASSSFMWYRIVHQDRYLAVMLDQKACSENDDVLIDGEHNAADNVSDHLEHTHCRLMGRMASRRGTVDIQINLEVTMGIDRALQDAARQVPPKWWVLPAVNRWDGGPDESLEDVLKLLIQITHYHLSIMLHLPHSLRKSKSQDQYSYSRIACVSASRELVNRYVRFRSTTRVAFCCRAIDYAVFTACVALILAHLVSGTDAEGGLSSILAHQRLSDQAIVAEVVGILAKLDMLSNDRQLGELASMLSFLANMDLMDPPNTSNEGRANTSNIVSPFEALQLTIPCVGRVLITKEGVRMNESNEFLPSHGQHVASGLPNCNTAQQENGHMHFENLDQQDAFGGLSDVNWMNPEVSYEYPPRDDQAQSPPEIASFCDAMDFSSYALIWQ